MAKSPYSIEDVYKEINTIDEYFYEMRKGLGSVEYANQFITKYCPKMNGSGYGNCRNYLQKANSGIINLLENLKKYNLEYDKLAEYAILFLSYKLNKHSEHKLTNLNDFYTKNIEKNEYYNNMKIKDNGPTYKDIINTKKDLMNTKEIYKFDYPFSILVSLYNEIKKKDMDCTKYSEKANYFAKNFEKLNNDSNINGNASYSKLLFTLSDDYNNLKNIYDSNNSCNFPPLPKVKTPPSKLIPALSTFSVIPVFLGISYKYSLFGVDKLFQRQYLRKKLKKVKKKMKLNI
ncbi:CIR protein PIR protein [Plasmodium vinckei brucechwatti]|uniref:CIR protein PIR protein n=1 Tax=Plasmodium vinckei brucechwatti TaxID=119398 RepID=A0A6V7SEU2_PLAVN|nr:CIR protein PIR protein [Plasmodium vinckei brucechwatti]